ncbi:hypothetical protein FH972_018336 [Carpinus fangiana]|uniref:non-specific serine/threonine protein kinase n=1 Tax=Carpinus fangiana TaxID=176857 RepID=A0A5N6RQ91_9ROSI|nr:hypothetical protein FH972_018336 [Carpinus fangiana]
MDLIEGVGESLSPPRSFGGGFSSTDVRTDVYNRLMESGLDEVVSNPEFRELLDAHFNRLPQSYGLDVNMDRVEDVLLHQKILALAKDPEKRPVYHIRFLENTCTRTDGDDDQEFVSALSTTRPSCDADDEGVVPSYKRSRDCVTDFEPCSKLEDLNLDVRNNTKDMEERYLTNNFSRRQELSHVPVHEVIFSTIDKPKLLSQLSALLSEIGLNIREAHVFSTTDGYSLDVFVVDGWHVEDADSLYEAMEKAVARSEGSWSRSSSSHSAVEKALATQTKSGDWEIDRRLLKMGDRIASGSCGDLYHGVYLSQDVAVKILRSEHLNEALEDEFTQEVAILREVRHKNVVRFIGACTKPPHLCIVTEYMPGGSLYDYLHKNHNILELPQLLKFAIDVSMGMEYLHKSNIIHRDLKTANLLMDNHNSESLKEINSTVIQNVGGFVLFNIMYIICNTILLLWFQMVQQLSKFVVFFVWQVPYDTMTPLQAALGVRQGLRPDIPRDAHPKLLELMQRCWEAVPDSRPSFSEITAELEKLVQDVQVQTPTRNHLEP